MNSHTKIRQVSTSKSRSIDFSDLISLPDLTPKPIPNHYSKSQESQETKQIHNTTNTMNTNTSDVSVQEDGVGEIFGVILGRNCSFSSASSHEFRAEKQNTALHSAVKRAFSMRRSSSVSEGYCRIHCQFDPDANNESLTSLLTRSKQKRGKILKACRRLFGF